METPKAGTIVWLKSGGPKMTVEGMHAATGKTICHWFSGSEVREGMFHPDELTDEHPMARIKPKRVIRR